MVGGRRGLQDGCAGDDGHRHGAHMLRVCFKPIPGTFPPVPSCAICNVLFESPEFDVCSFIQMTLA